MGQLMETGPAALMCIRRLGPSRGNGRGMSKGEQAHSKKQLKERVGGGGQNVKDGKRRASIEQETKTVSECGSHILVFKGGKSSLEISTKHNVSGKEGNRRSTVKTKEEGARNKRGSDG